MAEIPIQWLKYCTELIPCDIRQRFLTTYILNPNALTQRYLRRLYNISAGMLKIPRHPTITSHTSTLQAYHFPAVLEHIRQQRSYWSIFRKLAPHL